MPSPGYVLYTPSLRSSHLERLAPRPGFRLLASGRHPDCDPALLAAAPFPVRVADLDDLRADLRADPPAVLEVTEPLWRAHWPESLALADAAPEARLVTYALEVLPDPDPLPAGRLDAVVFGSTAAQAAYAASYPAARWARAVIPELRGRCLSCFPDGGRAPAEPEVVFAAEFSERKAIDLLMPAWQEVTPPGWRLRLLGWGPRTRSVLAWAEDRPEVDVVVSAARDQVHDAMRRAAVVVLPSRRVEGWREQIGLSLVEGLAHGCTLLTTDETGLAADLRRGGSRVVAAGDAAALAAGLATVTSRTPADKALPGADDDSRRRAVGWLAGSTEL